MARIRSLKPSFFLNEDLANLSPLHRLLFQGLWVIADASGRLHDKPGTIKVQTLPFDACDVDAMLTDLAAGDDPWIVRYEVNGKRYIQVVNFLKHQNPHNKEAKSVIPANLGAKTQSPVLALEEHETQPEPALHEPESNRDEPGGSLSLVSCSGSGNGNGFGNGLGAVPPISDLPSLLDRSGLNTYQRGVWFKNAEFDGDVLVAHSSRESEWIERHYLGQLQTAVGHSIRVVARQAVSA